MRNAYCLIDGRSQLLDLILQAGFLDNAGLDITLNWGKFAIERFSQITESLY